MDIFLVFFLTTFLFAGQSEVDAPAARRGSSTDRGLPHAGDPDGGAVRGRRPGGAAASSGSLKE